MTLYGFFFFFFLTIGGEILPGVEKTKVILLPRLGGSGHPGSYLYPIKDLTTLDWFVVVVVSKN